MANNTSTNVTEGINLPSIQLERGSNGNIFIPNTTSIIEGERDATFTIDSNNKVNNPPIGNNLGDRPPSREIHDIMGKNNNKQDEIESKKSGMINDGASIKTSPLLDGEQSVTSIQGISHDVSSGSVPAYPEVGNGKDTPVIYSNIEVGGTGNIIGSNMEIDNTKHLGGGKDDENIELANIGNTDVGVSVGKN